MTASTPQPIELWYWPTPNGWKVSIALEEMGLAYDLKPVNIGVGEQFAPEFLALSPKGRMPAIIDHGSGDGQPLSIFESGAILQHLGRKTGLFYPSGERARAEVEQWLFWQVGGIGPMAGQTHHFRQYAPRMLVDQRQLAYGSARYTNETNRLYRMLDKRLQDREFVAGDYSIADMAIWPRIKPWKNQGQDLDQFPALKAWYEKIDSRHAVARGMAAGDEFRTNTLSENRAAAEKARAVLFGQRAR